MEATNSDIQKKYEDLAVMQKERLSLRAKNSDVKANYPGINFFLIFWHFWSFSQFFKYYLFSILKKKLSLRDCQCGRASWKKCKDSWTNLNKMMWKLEIQYLKKWRLWIYQSIVLFFRKKNICFRFTGEISAIISDTIIQQKDLIFFMNVIIYYFFIFKN